MAASKPSKRKPFTFSAIIFLATLITFNIQYLIQLHQDVQNAVNHPTLATSLNWFEFVAGELGHEAINVALVNMDETMFPNKIPTKGEIVKVDFDRLDEAVQWSHLYPEWIDETNAKCPNVPMPVFENYDQLDVVVARVPSDEFGLKDVFRLQVNLVVANLLVRCGRVQSGISRPIFAVFIGASGPMSEIFRCDDLVLHDADYWIHRPELTRIRQIVLMPVGSCQLNPPLPHIGKELGIERLKQPREAYATIVHSTETYVCGAIALARSIIQLNTTKDLILLADYHISPKSINGLQSAGWKIKQIKRIRNPHSKKRSYNEWNYSKLRLWQLTDYDKIIFIDSDFIVTKSLDEFFKYPGISARGNNQDRFNSGLMLLEPSMCTFRRLMEKRWVVRSYNGGDQGYLNEMFPWWHRLPNKINHLTYFDPNNGEEDREHVVESDVYAIHYLGWKPWWCYRDYDCNWDGPKNQKFASDSANNIWWDVYDKASDEMKENCFMTPEMYNRFWNNRKRAKEANLSDVHWRTKIRDPRLNNKL